MKPGSCSASLVFGRLLLRSLGTIGFRDVTETNMTSPGLILELMTAYTKRKRGLETRHILLTLLALEMHKCGKVSWNSQARD